MKRSRCLDRSRDPYRIRSLFLYRFLFLVWVLFLTGLSQAPAQSPSPADEGAAGLYFSLKKLGTTLRVLHVVAHPDDEDGGMLTALSRGEGATVALFSVTRGEGGANLISDDFFDRLGILRTLEHTQAGRYYGIEQYYSSAVDYGYSKTLDEALRTWQGGDRILGDLVRVIRLRRPHVIAARFRGGPMDGHGHHQLSGVLAAKAFDAAGDPTQFPEQIKEGLRPWSPLKLYHDNINPRWRAEDSKLATLAIDTGRYDPLLGRSYAQVARLGLGFQRSQGMAGFLSPPGPSETYYRLVKSRMGKDYAPASESKFSDGLDVGWSRLIVLEQEIDPAATHRLKSASEGISLAEQLFDPKRPESCVESLLISYKAIENVLAKLQRERSNRTEQMEFDLNEKRTQLRVAIEKSLAIELRATAHRQDGPEDNPFFGPSSSGFDFLTEGQRFEVRYQFSNRSEKAIAIRSVEFRSPTKEIVIAPVAKLGEPKLLRYNESFSGKMAGATGDGDFATRPYWRRKSIQESFYEWSNPPSDLAPIPAPVLILKVTYEVDGVPLELERPVEVRTEFQGNPVVYPLVAAPSISVWPENSTSVLLKGHTEARFRVRVTHHSTEPKKVEFDAEAPTGWRVASRPNPISFEKVGESRDVEFVLEPPANFDSDATISFVAKVGNRAFREGFVTVTAPDLGRINYFRSATTTVRPIDVDIPKNLQIGYIMGSGDEVPKALAQMGATPEMLGPEYLSSGDLDRFDAIIAGVRAYAVRNDLRANNGRLLDYVANGGVFIVQYQTPEFDQNFGPYPYKMGQNPEEVSEEDARVAILAPEHEIFTQPNRVSEKDFEGWVEQRGSKFLTSWDERYTPLLECHDTRQEEQRGGMLIARHGKGAYVYSAYAWYRQLPMGVPGAFRIYANMISLKKTLKPTP